LDVESEILKEDEKMRVYEYLGTKEKVYLKLLYWGSEDGLSGERFHSLCDHKGETLTLVKNDKGKRFGGRAKKSWTSNGGFVEDADAFLFSLDLN